MLIGLTPVRDLVIYEPGTLTWLCINVFQMLALLGNYTQQDAKTMRFDLFAVWKNTQQQNVSHCIEEIYHLFWLRTVPKWSDGH